MCCACWCAVHRQRYSGVSSENDRLASGNPQRKKRACISRNNRFLDSSVVVSQQLDTWVVTVFLCTSAMLDGKSMSHARDSRISRLPGGWSSGKACTDRLPMNLVRLLNEPAITRTCRCYDGEPCNWFDISGVGYINCRRYTGCWFPAAYHRYFFAALSCGIMN